MGQERLRPEKNAVVAALFSGLILCDLYFLRQIALSCEKIHVIAAYRQFSEKPYYFILEPDLLY